MRCMRFTFFGTDEIEDPSGDALLWAERLRSGPMCLGFRHAGGIALRYLWQAVARACSGAPRGSVAADPQARKRSSSASETPDGARAAMLEHQHILHNIRGRVFTIWLSEV